LTRRRPTVGVLSCYFTLFDEQMPAGFRQEREAVVRGYVDLLGREFDVVEAGMLTTENEGDCANAILRVARPDVIVAGVAQLTRTVRAAAVASSLRRATVLRVGTWFPGYLDVESSPSDLERLGVTEHAGRGARVERRVRRRRGRSNRRRPRRPLRTRLDPSRRAGRRAKYAARTRTRTRRPRGSRERVRRDGQLPFGRAALEPGGSGLPRVSAHRS